MHLATSLHLHPRTLSNSSCSSSSATRVRNKAIPLSHCSFAAAAYCTCRFATMSSCRTLSKSEVTSSSGGGSGTPAPPVSEEAPGPSRRLLVARSCLKAANWTPAGGDDGCSFSTHPAAGFGGDFRSSLQTHLCFVVTERQLMLTVLPGGPDKRLPTCASVMPTRSRPSILSSSSPTCKGDAHAGCPGSRDLMKKRPSPVASTARPTPAAYAMRHGSRRGRKASGSRHQALPFRLLP